MHIPGELTHMRMPPLCLRRASAPPLALRPCPLQDGTTTLHFAGAFGHEGIVEQLIRAKADVNAADKEGKTARDHAVNDDIKAIIDKAQAATTTASGEDRPRQSSATAASAAAVAAVAVDWR